MLASSSSSSSSFSSYPFSSYLQVAQIPSPSPDLDPLEVAQFDEVSEDETFSYLDQSLLSYCSSLLTRGVSTTIT